MSCGCAVINYGMRNEGDAFLWSAAKRMSVVHRTYKYQFFRNVSVG